LNALRSARLMALKPGMKIRDDELTRETVGIKSLTPAPGDTEDLKIYNDEVAKYMIKWTQLGWSEQIQWSGMKAACR
jgi:hypothetical protein